MPHTIAVGVDGSAPSLVALRWALAHAVTHHSEVLAVVALPLVVDKSRDVRRVAMTRREQADHLADVTRAVTRAADGASVRVEAREGNPTEVLLAVSHRVDLLVVGGHGYRG